MSKRTFSGKLFEVEQVVQPDGRVFEIARRAPGGKVFDTLAEYQKFRESGDDILKAAASKAKAEAREEAGIEVRKLELFRKSALGATIEWDLFVFEVRDWREITTGQQLEPGEQIETDNWITYTKAEEMIYEGHLQEDRIALILLQWLHKQR